MKTPFNNLFQLKHRISVIFCNAEKTGILVFALFMNFTWIQAQRDNRIVDPIGGVPDEITVKLQIGLTPDGNGINDVFLPDFSSKPAIYKLQIICERNGKVVFETTNPNETWDGENHHRQHFRVEVHYGNSPFRMYCKESSLFLIR